MHVIPRRLLIVAILALLVCCPDVRAYSVLSHEAIIDSAWDAGIKPLLLARFPNATPDELRQAHAFAYGGAIIQDMGYYPHGSHFFSDLTHYVRSGDFVLALIRDSQDLNDYAFALGALAHYCADTNGHRLAVNVAVPILYPRLKKKFGPVVTYEDNPSAHLKTEFGFDVLEVAKGHYAPDSYHDFIGFEVAKPLLERAFEETYSIPLQSVFGDLDKSLGSYRYDVRSLIPKATKVAWALKKDDIRRDAPTMTERRFLYNLSRSSYEKRWGKVYQKPGFGSKILAFFLAILPKIGPLRTLSFRMPTPQAETLFMSSFNVTLTEYRRLLDQVRAGQLDLDNPNFDTGAVTLPGTYFMQDDCYAELLDGLAKTQFKGVSPELRANILAFYADPNAPIATKKNHKEWVRITGEIDALKSVAPAAPAPSVTGAVR
jgi:hypothetical protein